MNIAIASETEEIDGLVPATFKESPFLMIIDADKNQIFHVYGKQDPDNLVFAKKGGENMTVRQSLRTDRERTV